MILCMIAGGAVGYYAASMLLAKTPRVFKTTWKGMLAVALGCAALCGAMKYDLLRRDPPHPRTGQRKAGERLRRRQPIIT